MPNDFETILKALTSSKNGQIPGTEHIMQMLGTDEGRALINMIAQSGSSSLKSAANSAMSGDSESAKNFFLQFLSTKEGAAMASKLSAMFGNPQHR